jgi:hypothetical protein
MIMYIPTSYLTGYSLDSYLYLYSAFGQNFGAGDGYEEWWVDKSHLTTPPDVPTPEPGTALLLGFGLVVAARRIRRTRDTR